MPRRKPTLLNYPAYILWRTVGVLLWFLPRRASILLADVFAFLMHRVLRIRRGVVMDNLTRAFGATRTPEELDRVARDAYRNSMLTFIEFVQPRTMWWNTLDLFEGFDGAEHFESVKGAPFIVVTAHMGNWESLGELAAKRYGLRLLAFMKPLHNHLINRAIVQQRLQLGLELITSNSSNLKTAVTAARDGRILTFVADQDARRHGIFVDFLGTPASTAEGPALFAYKLNVPILPAFSVRIPTGQRGYRVMVAPPIYPNPEADRDAEVRRMTREHVAALENAVRSHPDCYFWLHRRWKTQPKISRSSGVTV